MFALPDPSPRPLKFFAVLLIALAAFSYAFVPERADNDVWWHLKTGQVIVESGWRLPERDVFTYTAADMLWHNHEWLAQALFYKIYQWGGGMPRDLIGLRALILAKAIGVALTFLIVLTLVQQRARLMPLSALIALLALDTARLTMFPRPPILTFFLFALFLLILSNWKTRRLPNAALLALPPIMVLWANLHGGFLIGLIAIFFFLAGEVAERLLWNRGLPPEEVSVEPYDEFRRRMIWLGAVFVACGVASLCTPYGIQLYLLPGRVMSAKSLVKTIAELQTPLRAGVAPFFISLFVMLALTVIGLAAARLVSRRRPPASDLLLVAFFGYQALMHQRHAPLFAIAAAPTLGWAAGEILDWGGQIFRRRMGWIAAGAALILAAHWTMIRDARANESYLARNIRLARGETYVRENFPADLADFVLANDFTGRVFNPTNAAGYLIFRLSPKPHKMFTDSRFDVFGDRFAWDHFAVVHGLERGPDERLRKFTAPDWKRYGFSDPSEGIWYRDHLDEQYTWDTFDWSGIGLTPDEGHEIRRRLGSATWSDILDKWNVNWVIMEHAKAGFWRLYFSPDWELVYSWTRPDALGKPVGWNIFVRKTDANKELIARAKEHARAMQAGKESRRR